MKFGGLAGMVGIWVAVFSTLTVIYFTFFPDTSIGDSIIPIFKITFKVLVGLMLIFESMVLWKAPKV